MKVMFLSSLILIFGSVIINAQIVPKNWVSPEALEGVETPIQDQLDTGKAMVSTVRHMEDLRDARLFLVYMLLYEKLDKAGQESLYNDQVQWIKNRGKMLEALKVPNGGDDVWLNIASKQLDVTEQRIKELSERLKQKSA